MIETYYAGSYWLARPEPAEACAHRAERFFHLLAQCDPAWTRWYRPVQSFEEARNLQVNTEAASFQRLFAAREHQIEEGFSFGLWAGGSPQETSTVDVRCGFAAPWLSSACVLKPFHEGAARERVLTASGLTQALHAMVLAWDPEWGIATSETHRDSVTERAKPGTFVGWVMYFSRLRGTVPPLPAPARIEPVEDKGTLIILTPERFTASNPEHTALAAHVHELLDRAGLLRPLRPWPVE
ncbi:immunity 52 family protein [Stigmatella erecta]|uniref:Immunity protein 52 n=1 Tax=Stigmatella erecta TaxID=83460 RepID=A0A1H9ZUL4_9BACT|nr:immunity 52 family protein [Stigmatella erecta]SES85450.1 Immunity protein 52 [Stigmatella erecta]